MAQPVNGRIVNYRIGIRTQMSKEILIQFPSADSAALAGRLVGRKVVWKSENSKFVGKIVGLHGRNGMLRARFKNGVPGQALGTTVELVCEV